MEHHCVESVMSMYRQYYATTTIAYRRVFPQGTVPCSYGLNSLVNEVPEQSKSKLSKQLCLYIQMKHILQSNQLCFFMQRLSPDHAGTRNLISLWLVKV